MPSDTRSSKAALRDRFRQVRSSLSLDAHADRSRALCRRAYRLDVLRSAGRVHVYWPMIEDREVDTRPLIDALKQNGTEIVLPVVTQYPPDEPAMEHRLFRGIEETERNRWAIPEPVGTPRVSPDTIDAVVVPALGAGRNGHRIGHGTGYYDAFLRPLAEAGTPRLAFVYDDCLVERIPPDAHDVPVSLLVTERETIRVSL
jgi:5-formyltetrahydrofolate cyclo-ligase